MLQNFLIGNNTFSSKDFKSYQLCQHMQYTLNSRAPIMKTEVFYMASCFGLVWFGFRKSFLFRSITSQKKKISPLIFQEI